MSAQRGVILIAVLWILAVLTLIAAGQSNSARLQIRLAAADVQLASARAAAESGIWVGVQNLLQSTSAPPRIVQVGGGSAHIQIEHEMGKIDLNVAPPELIAGVFSWAAQNPDDAQVLTDAVLDWRDRDNLKRAKGAEDDEYRSAGYSYGAKDGPFNTVEELRLVNGMTSELFNTVAPLFTVYSNQPGIDAMHAPIDVLIAISGGRRWEKDTGQIVDETDNRQRWVNQLPIASRFLIQSDKSIITLKSTGIVGNTRVRIDATVQISRSGTPPYSILAWRTGVSDELPGAQ